MGLGGHIPAQLYQIIKIHISHKYLEFINDIWGVFLLIFCAFSDKPL